MMMSQVGHPVAVRRKTRLDPQVAGPAAVPERNWLVRRRQPGLRLLFAARMLPQGQTLPPAREWRVAASRQHLATATSHFRRAVRNCLAVTNELLSAPGAACSPDAALIRRRRARTKASS